MIEWIKITDKTILPKDKIILVSWRPSPFGTYEEQYAGKYEILAFSFEDKTDGQQSWHVSCGHVMEMDDEVAFNIEIVERYSHYAIINPPLMVSKQG